MCKLAAGADGGRGDAVMLRRWRDSCNLSIISPARRAPSEAPTVCLHYGVDEHATTCVVRLHSHVSSTLIS